MAPGTEARPKKGPTRKVDVVVRIKGAKNVAITGDFTGWREDGIRLVKAPSGEWRTTVDLAPGEYQYRLRVDGAWVNPAEAEKRVPNSFGSENCILTVD